MSFSAPRALVFLLIGLPIGFILTALAFVVLGQSIEAARIAPYAMGIAVLFGLAMGFKGSSK